MKLLEVKRPRLEDRHENAIAFIEQDVEGVLAPHNDAVVVTVNIADYNVHRVFINNGSSIDILYYFVYFQIGFTLDHLSRFDILIQDFAEDSVILKGMIKLPVAMGMPPQRTTIQVNFLMVKLSSTYSAILGCLS
ncbi:uncharacterized protein [Elaeis guineensis]|uniref:uncharacterized protein n=1 Tax=Elaeis guineensis var. tenera TaxID=51953 RepID=UPI003C6CC73F